MNKKMNKLLAVVVSCVMLVVGYVPAAAATAVGTATDPAASYDVTVGIKNSTKVVVPTGVVLSSGNIAAGNDLADYVGLAVSGSTGTSVAGYIQVDLGEAFKEILFAVAENLPDKGNKKWDKIGGNRTFE